MKLNADFTINIRLTNITNKKWISGELNTGNHTEKKSFMLVMDKKKKVALA